jgi:hypothetical protein
MKNPPLTIQRHKEIGARLAENLGWLVSLSIEVQKAYGKTSRLARTADRALLSISRLRHHLDEQCYQDYPKEKESIYFYYPNAQKNNNTNQGKKHEPAQ